MGTDGPVGSSNPAATITVESQERIFQLKGPSSHTTNFTGGALLPGQQQGTKPKPNPTLGCREQLLLLVVFILGVALLNMPSQICNHHPSSTLATTFSGFSLIVPVQLACFIYLALLLFPRLPQGNTNVVAFMTSVLVCLLFVAGMQWHRSTSDRRLLYDTFKGQS